MENKFKEQLEPVVRGNDVVISGTRAALSAAISLKRIADALDLQNKLAEETLREVQRQANPMHVYDPFNPE